MNLPARSGKDSFASGPYSFRNIITDLGEVFAAVYYSDLRNCLLSTDSGGEHRGIAGKTRAAQSRRRPHRRICNRLLTADESRELREGTADDTTIREAMFHRLLPSMLEAAVERFRAGAGRGIVLWSQDASVHYVPEPQLATALRIEPETREDIQAIVRRYSPESEAVMVSERRDELELVRLGPGRTRFSLGTRPLNT
jgi:hypothetical protein